MLMLGLLVKVFLHEACQNRIRLLSSLSSSLSLSSSFTSTGTLARTHALFLSLSHFRIPEIWLTVWNHRCQSSRLCTLYQFVYKLLYCHSLMRPSRMLWGENTAAIFIFIFMTHCPFPASNSFIFLQPAFPWLCELVEFVTTKDLRFLSLSLDSNPARSLRISSQYCFWHQHWHHRT